MFGENKLRVRELFSVINGQNKLNANKDNVIVGRFGADRYALAAQSDYTIATHTTQLAGYMGPLCKRQCVDNGKRIKINR